MSVIFDRLTHFRDCRSEHIFAICNRWFQSSESVTFAQCCISVGSASLTVVQHYNDICVCVSCLLISFCFSEHHMSIVLTPVAVGGLCLGRT